MSDMAKHPVLFVGAGPGDPELITVKGRLALEEADLVVYAGSLVPKQMLTWVGPGCRAVNSAGLSLEEFMEPMIKAHEKGQKVVRLHTGDPSLYGATNEQFRYLNQRGVAWRVIPGVTAAFAAAAALGLEYTLPELSQSLILTRAAGRTPVPEAENLGSMAAHQTSLVIYLSAGQAEKVGRNLAEAYGADSKVAVVYRASWPDQKILWADAKNLARSMSDEGIDRQALIIAGKAVSALCGPSGEEPVSKLYDAGFSHGYRKAKGEED